MNNNKIHRWGNKTYTNLTPRERDIEGLSFYLECTRPKYMETFINLVNSTQKLVAEVDNMETGHVKVYPVDIQSIYEWINSRNECESNPHEYTILLYNIVEFINLGRR